MRGPQEFAAGIKELQDKLAAIAKLVDMKPTQQYARMRCSGLRAR